MEGNPRPVLVRWELTPRCNRSCLYCQVSGETRSENRLVGNWRAIVRSLLDSDVSVVALTGGEPTVHPAIVDIIQRLSDGGKDVFLQTNGFDRSLLEEMMNSLSCVYVSLDAPIERVNDAVRGRNAFHEADSIFRKLSSVEPFGRRLTIGISCTLTSLNVETLSELVKYAFDLQIDPRGNSPCSRCRECSV